MDDNNYRYIGKHVSRADGRDLPGGDEGAAGNSVRRIASQLKGKEEAIKRGILSALLLSAVLLAPSYLLSASAMEKRSFDSETE